MERKRGDKKEGGRERRVGVGWRVVQP